MSELFKVATVTLNPAIDQTIWIPNFQAGHVNRVQHIQTDAGGKGVNVASVLSDYGFQIAVTGFLGEENTPIFDRLFAWKKIDDRFVRIAGRTRVGIKIIDEENTETTDINYPGQAPTEAAIQRLFQIIEELAVDYPWFVLAGSLPAGVSPDIYGDLISLIKSKGRAVALDTSGQALQQALEVGPTLVKPNIDELQELVHYQLNTHQYVIQAARQWLTRGIETVVVSMGAEGAIFVEAEQLVLAAPPRVDVKSTVGAGDAMVSGTVAAKMQGASLADCARLATAFSLSAVTNVGAGLSSPEEVEAFKNQVSVRTLRSIND